MEYEASRSMPAGKFEAFDVAADLEHMADWLPTTLQVTANDDGTIHVEGDAGREPDIDAEGSYSEDGLFRAQREQLRLEWGSDEDGRYAGWLQFTGIEDDASEAVLHLSFLGDQPMAREHDPAMDQGMTEALDRLADVVRSRT